VARRNYRVCDAAGFRERKQKSRRLAAVYGPPFRSQFSCLVRPGVWGNDQRDLCHDLRYGDELGFFLCFIDMRLQDAAVKRLFAEPDNEGAMGGMGPESFYLVHLEGPPSRHARGSFLSCDNSWVEFLIETGFVGLSIMVMLLLWPRVGRLEGVLEGAGPIDRHLEFMYCS